MLDAPEYLHLAIHASQEKNHHAALNYLNQALQIDPNNAAIRYFLAAEHAELGLFERACTGMEEALALDADMDLARFQLGLLYLQLQRNDDAKDAFQFIRNQATEESLKSFAEAYLRLLDESPDAAVALFEKGLVNCENPPLKEDMARVLTSLRKNSVSAKIENGSESDVHVFLGAYRETLETPNDKD